VTIRSGRQQNLVRGQDLLLILLITKQSRHKLHGHTLHVFLSPPLETCSIWEAQPASELHNGILGFVDNFAKCLNIFIIVICGGVT
jgi:hypothetical protein